MLDNASVTPENDSAVINEISLCVYQAILEIQQQQPELLREKYRSVPWHEARNRSTFLVKLKQGLSTSQDQETLTLKVQKFLQFLLISSYFELPIFAKLIEKILSLTQQRVDSNQTASVEYSQQTESTVSPKPERLGETSKGIAILLLDADQYRKIFGRSLYLSHSNQSCLC